MECRTALTSEDLLLSLLCCLSSTVSSVSESDDFSDGCSSFKGLRGKLLSDGVGDIVLVLIMLFGEGDRVD